MVRQGKSASILAIFLLIVATATWAQTEVNPLNEPNNDVQLDASENLTSDEVISDLLIVLDSDGRSHTAQHTIASSGPSIGLHLPGSVIPQEVHIFGPDRESQREHYQSDPKLLSISNGSAFVRYQHQYGNEVEQIQPGHFVLSVPSIPANVETLKLSRSATTWVFPSEYELVSYTVTERNTGSWVVVSNTLTFHQLSAEPVPLSIAYKHKKATALTVTTTCPEGAPQIDNCADDNDKDGVPDYRDICISAEGENANAYGCRENHNMILDAIVFTTGRTYLDVSARAALDKVANALTRTPEVHVEIGSHTDNEGAESKNLRLSKKRADAVRHYLILKGVNPNAIRATGYGEQYPIRDNSSADGRRANRRVELVIIN